MSDFLNNGGKKSATKRFLSVAYKYKNTNKAWGYGYIASTRQEQQPKLYDEETETNLLIPALNFQAALILGNVEDNFWLTAFFRSPFLQIIMTYSDPGLQNLFFLLPKPGMSLPVLKH